MQSASDLYASLGVERSATPEQIGQAYRLAARRFHPEVNSDPQAKDEFKRLAAAYEVLNDPQRRAEYDSRTAARRPAQFTAQVMFSRAKLMRLPEPQIVYVLVEIGAPTGVAAPAPLLNLCLVIDRSTSMQGARLDQVKSAASQIVNGLGDKTSFRSSPSATGPKSCCRRSPAPTSRPSPASSARSPPAAAPRFCRACCAA
jgi:curved DNA-binding protein CbpA